MAALGRAGGSYELDTPVGPDLTRPSLWEYMSGDATPFRMTGGTLHSHVRCKEIHSGHAFDLYDRLRVG